LIKNQQAVWPWQ